MRSKWRARRRCRAGWRAGIGLSPGPRQALARFGWALLSVGHVRRALGVLWALGMADEKLLPPPHIFLGNIPDQATFLQHRDALADRRRPEQRPLALRGRLHHHRRDRMRVFVGLLIAATLSITSAC